MFGQILVNGLVLSGSYALVAVGLTLTFGVMRMVNFAEGQSVMIGAFVAYTAVPYLGYVGAIAAAMAVNAVLGVILERTAFRPFRGRAQRLDCLDGHVDRARECGRARLGHDAAAVRDDL